MFLNDLIVRADKEFPLAIKEHKHTYWLKYLILKHVCSMKRVSSKDLIRYFHELGYEEVLIRVVIGSLSTSEFHCLQIDSESHHNDRQRWLTPTDRGSALVSSNFGLSASNNNCEFCFSFVYLQLVVEDNLLALPKNLLTYMEPTGDYSYIYLRDSSYGPKASAVIKNRAKASMWFLKVLSASLNVEIKSSKLLHSRLSDILPDLDAAKISLVEEIRRVGRAIDARDVLNDLEKEMNSFEEDVSQLEIFFRDYYQSGVSVS